MEVILKKQQQQKKNPPQNKAKQMLILAPFNLGEKKSMFKINRLPKFNSLVSNTTMQ